MQQENLIEVMLPSGKALSLLCGSQTRTPVLQRRVHRCPCLCSSACRHRQTVWLRMQVKRVAVLVSKMSHCLYDLLIRHRSGEAKLYSFKGV